MSAPRSGRPDADITPATTRTESKPTEVFLHDLEQLREVWRRIGDRGEPSDYDTGLTTDDMLP